MNTLISSSKEIGRRIIIPSAKKYSLRNIPDSISVIEVKGILMVESSITLSGKTIDAKEGQIITYSGEGSDYVRQYKDISDK